MSKRIREETYRTFIQGDYENSSMGSFDPYSIHFDYYPLKTTKTKEIADALEYNKQINYIHFHRCKISDEGASYLISKIRDNIKTLNLHGNYLKKSAFVDLCNMLKTNKSITDLCIGSIKIEPGVMKCVAEMLSVNDTIQELNMGKMRMTIDDVRILCECLGINNGVRHLHLFNNIAIGSIMGYTYLSDLISTNKNIATLNIHSCSLDSSGINSILKAMIDNTSITHLTLDNNDISGESVDALCEVIKHNKTLLKLDLAFNTFCDRDVGYILAALKENNTLQGIFLIQRVSGKPTPTISDEIMKLVYAHFDKSNSWDVVDM